MSGGTSIGAHVNREVQSLPKATEQRNAGQTIRFHAHLGREVLERVSNHAESAGLSQHHEKSARIFGEVGQSGEQPGIFSHDQSVR